jgi:hypothetical protein
MAEVINLSSFEFNTQNVEKSLTDLQSLLFDIQKEQKRYSKSNSDLQKQYNDLDKQQIELKKRKLEETQAYKDVVSQMRELESQQKNVFMSQKDLAIQAAVVRKEYNDTVAVQKTMLTSTGALVTGEEALTAALSREVNTRAEAKKSSIELNKLKDQLNPKIKEEAELLDQLNAKVNSNNELLRSTGSEREKQIANIGNYKNSIIEAANELNIFNGGFAGFITRSQEAGGVGPLVTKSFTGISAGIKGMTSASLTFLATPLGAAIAAIALVLTPLISYLTSTQAGIDKVTAVTRPLKAIFESLIGVLQNVGKFLFDAFSNPKKTLTELADFVKNNLINRFTAFGTVLDGIINLDFKKVADGALQFATGVEGLTGKIAGAAKETDKFLSDAIKKGQELDRLEKELEKTRISNKTLLGELTEEVKAQNLIAEDQTKTLAQREEATVKSIDAAKAINVLKQKELDLEIAILKNKQDRNDTSREEQLALAELIAKKNEANAQELELETTQKNKLNAIRKEASTKAIAARALEVDNAIKKSQEELALFIAQQGFRAKTLEEQLNVDKQIADKSIAILKQELAAKKISLLQYNAAVANIQQDLLKKQAELTVANAEQELEEYLKVQEEKLKSTERLNAERVNSQKLTLLNLQIEEENFQKLRFEQGLINETEYQNELNRIKEESLVKANDLEKRYTQQSKEDRDTARVLEFEDNLLKSEEEGAIKFEQDTLRADFEYQEAQIKLGEQKEAGLINEANYNKALELLGREHAEVLKNIETEKFNFKLGVLSTTFGNVAETLGKETAAGKAAGIAQATINTFQGISEVWKSPAVFPEPYNTILKGVQSGVTLASGIKSVKAITSTKAPKGQNPTLQGLATGGVVAGGVAIRRANGDDRLITAKTGEVVLTDKQQSFIGSDIFAMAGVPGFAKGGVVGPSSISTVQRGITSSVDSLDLTATISEAVRAGANAGTKSGAAAGTSSGIIGLSDNRQIQNNSSF